MEKDIEIESHSDRGREPNMGNENQTRKKINKCEVKQRKKNESCTEK